MHKLLVIAVLSLFQFCLCTQYEECPLYLNCNHTIIPIHNDSYVENYCQEEDGYMSGRCCFSNNTVIGLDLRECEIKRLNLSKTDFDNLIVFDLRENEFEKFIAEDLLGLINLKDLYLPPHIPCPGGNDAWESVSHPQNMTHCFREKDPCAYQNISCTDKGDCIHTGPGSAKCVCKPGQHGYKCLNKGEFPSTAFAFAVVIPALVLTVIVWFVQGRDAYKMNTS